MKIIINESQLKMMINEIRSDDDHLSTIFQDYYSTGRLDKITFTDNKLTWLFNQMIGIIDDLKKYRIESNDFTNLDNLGIKKNGNLGYFDIGYGNYFDDSDKDVPKLDIDEIELKIEDNIVQKIVKKYSEGDYKKIGDNGANGVAYSIGGGKVLKITRDKTEAINSNKLIGKTPNHLAEIYDVKMYPHQNETYFIIVLEHLRLTPALIKYYNKLNGIVLKKLNKHYDPNIVNYIRKKYPFVADFIMSLMYNGYEKTWEMYGDEVNNHKEFDFNEISDLAEWIRDSSTNNHDIDDEPPVYLHKILKKLLL